MVINSTHGNFNNAACAACKYQRRKCAADCPLAPYFPAEQAKEFLNVHRLFGVSNVLRILKQIHDPCLKAQAMSSIVFEANVWANDPSHGCLGIVNLLLSEIQNLTSQIHIIRMKIFLLQNHPNESASTTPSTTNTNINYHSFYASNNPMENIGVNDSTIIDNNTTLTLSNAINNYEGHILTTSPKLNDQNQCISTTTLSSIITTSNNLDLANQINFKLNSNSVTNSSPSSSSNEGRIQIYNEPTKNEIDIHNEGVNVIFEHDLNHVASIFPLASHE